MLLAVDIGNSHIKFGRFESSSLIDKFSIPTALDYSVEEFRLDRLRRVGDDLVKFDSVFIASVVPEINPTIADAMVRLLNVQPHFIDHTYDLGLTIYYQPPESAGIDRLVNASAAAARYGTPVIACSFGTATTFDVVSSDSVYLGGAIAPGMRLMAESLHLKTSKLPAVSIERPESAVGTTTESSIRSGVYFGYIGMVEGVLARTIEQIGAPAKVVGTGGLVKTVASESGMIDIVDEDLTLNGIRLIAERRAA